MECSPYFGRVFTGPRDVHICNQVLLPTQIDKVFWVEHGIQECCHLRGRPFAAPSRSVINHRLFLSKRECLAPLLSREAIRGTPTARDAVSTATT